MKKQEYWQRFRLEDLVYHELSARKIDSNSIDDHDPACSRRKISSRRMDFSSDYPDEEDSGLDSHMVEQLTNNIRQPATTGFPSTARNLEKKSKTIKMSSLQNVTKSVCRAQLFYRYSLTLAVASASPRNWFVIARESLWCHFWKTTFCLSLNLGKDTLPLN